MAKIPTSNYANDQTFTCSVPAEVYAGGDYPHKVILRATNSIQKSRESDTGLYMYTNESSQTALFVQSRFPIFVQKKSVGSYPIERLISNVNISKYDGYDATAEQYYMAVFEGGSDANKYTVVMNGSYSSRDLWWGGGVPESVGTLNAKITAIGNENRMSFTKNDDGSYSGSHMPSEKTITGEETRDGKVWTGGISFFANGDTSESAPHLGRKYLADGYSKYTEPYTGAPLSAPSFRCATSRIGFNGAFMNHSGSATREEIENGHPVTYTINCTVSSTLSEIDNPSFETIAEWYLYCKGQV